MHKDQHSVTYPLSLEQSPQLEAATHEDFFRRVRRIDATNPRHPRTGHSVLVRDETIRFRQIPHLHFAPSSIGKAEPRHDPLANQTVEEIMVYFMGLLGVNGPLPTVISDIVLAKAKGVPHPDMDYAASGDSAFRSDTGPAAFIDLFNHRFISLFYRAAVSSNKAVDFDRPEESRFHTFIGSFIGLGSADSQNRMQVPDTAALYFSGHYSCPTKHAEGLCQLLSDYTGARVAIGENVGHWVPVPAQNYTQLGVNRAAGALGSSAMLGSRYWDRTMKFRLVIGPLTLPEYLKFAPAGPLVEAIRSMVLLYCGREFICEANPVLHHAEIPECILGRHSRLGFTSWLISKAAPTDAANFIIPLVQ